MSHLQFALHAMPVGSHVTRQVHQTDKSIYEALIFRAQEECRLAANLISHNPEMTRTSALEAATKLLDLSSMSEQSSDVSPYRHRN